FLEGCLIVPTFVIEELQHIADSSDNIRRNKGRRGLELLSKMQKHSSIKIDIMDVTDPAILEEREVDAKLIRLCKQLQASIITNDYNLNKVAELQGITVLNINELTNAVKMIVYPGETMHVTVIKEGKENGQGVGYLEDGTMVVVEDAQHQIGRDLEVMVTSVFQTAAGRMIFTRKVKEEAHYNNEHSLHDVSEVNMYG
ncbi:MAG: TRAM domain-containing protein, partial [Syntrophomonadaceae bacterium]